MYQTVSFHAQIGLCAIRFQFIFSPFVFSARLSMHKHGLRLAHIQQRPAAICGRLIKTTSVWDTLVKRCTEVCINNVAGDDCRRPLARIYTDRFANLVSPTQDTRTTIYRKLATPCLFASWVTFMTRNP